MNKHRKKKDRSLETAGKKMRCWALYVREAKRAKMCYTDRTDDAVQYLKRFKFSFIKKV